MLSNVHVYSFRQILTRLICIFIRSLEKLQQFGHYITVSFGPFSLPSYGLLQNGRDHSTFGVLYLSLIIIAHVNEFYANLLLVSEVSYYIVVMITQIKNVLTLCDMCIY